MPRHHHESAACPYPITDVYLQLGPVSRGLSSQIPVMLFWDTGLVQEAGLADGG